MPSSHLILCCRLLLMSSIFSSIRVFSNESALRIRWPKHWSFSPSPSSEYLGLISFRIDWFDLPVVQGALKSLLQQFEKQHFFGTQPFLWSNSDRCTRCELIRCKQKHSTTASWKAPWKTACVRGSFASSSSPLSPSCCIRCDVMAGTQRTFMDYELTLRV